MPLRLRRSISELLFDQDGRLPPDILNYVSFDEGSHGGGDIRTMHLSSTAYRSTYNPNLPRRLDWRLLHRMPMLELSTVEASFMVLCSLFDHENPQTLTLVELYARGCKAYDDH